MEGALPRPRWAAAPATSKDASPMAIPAIRVFIVTSFNPQS
jgi:hypothetical protein